VLVQMISRCKRLGSMFQYLLPAPSVVFVFVAAFGPVGSVPFIVAHCVYFPRLVQCASGLQAVAILHLDVHPIAYTDDTRQIGLVSAVNTAFHTLMQ
jgi:hypothetical protein